MIAPLEVLSVSEAVELCAPPGPFYAETFFPKAYRQAGASFDKEIWEVLGDPNERYVAMKIFRGGAKTTRLRIFGSKRIAYGLSRYIIFVSNSEGHAVRSVAWFKRQVEYNRVWADAFSLRPGGKWAESEIEIIHGVEEQPVRILGVGITGQVRGFLSDDDQRPDLIVADDVDNEETTATPEQRLKAQKLFFGALGKSLAPPTEATDPKMVLAQTPLAPGDTIDLCANDPAWKTLTYGCYDEHGNSTWEARFPKEYLDREKESHIRKNQLSMWLREMECRLVSDENASFRLPWLKKYTELPDDVFYVIGVDPAISESKTADYFAIVVLACIGRRRYIVEYEQERGLNPLVAVMKLVELVLKYRPRSLSVETVAFQKVLAILLEEAFKRQGIYVVVKKIDDKRRKADRILQTVGDAATAGELYVKETHLEFLELFGEYSPGFKGHEDLLDATAVAIMGARNLTLNADDVPPPLPRPDPNFDRSAFLRAP
jgi:hypothetical protein